jgi:ubiquinone/menaquinone biosynthesis C-methylase UbiE
MPRSDDIRAYWDQKADTLRTDPSATMKDVLLRGLEIEAIASRLLPEDTLLDVGTGNAYAAIAWSARCQSIVATDFSTSMVAVAREAIASAGCRNVGVEEANVLDLSRYAGAFSATSCVRCLINLPEPREQFAALDQLCATLRPGGRLFLIEGIREGFESMNLARERSGLSRIPLNWHNRLFSQAELEQRLSQRVEIVERVDFGEYYLLSRIAHPLLVAPEEPRFGGRLNEVASQIWRSGIARGACSSLSTLVLWVCRRSG